MMTFATKHSILHRYKGMLWLTSSILNYTNTVTQLYILHDACNVITFFSFLAVTAHPLRINNIIVTPALYGDYLYINGLGCSM